jgi:hypothetical protein
VESQAIPGSAGIPFRTAYFSGGEALGMRQLAAALQPEAIEMQKTIKHLSGLAATVSPSPNTQASA